MKLFNTDCINALDYVEPETVSLVCTSPPYNIQDHKDLYQGYDDNVEDYIKYLVDRFEKMFILLRDGGRLCININQMFVMPDVLVAIREIGFTHRATIIWDKANIPKRTAWGSWMLPSNPNLLPPFEYILVFHKGSPKLVGDRKNADITKEEFIEYTNCMWRFPGKVQKYETIKAVFPDELPYRLIKFFTYKGDTVLDPFSGSGTTMRVAQSLGRNSIGFEVSEDIYKEACSVLEFY
jgi:site-specific DNA-methyltransferase (adenine-specific)